MGKKTKTKHSRYFLVWITKTKKIWNRNNTSTVLSWWCDCRIRQHPSKPWCYTPIVHPTLDAPTFWWQMHLMLQLLLYCNSMGMDTGVRWLSSQNHWRRRGIALLTGNYLLCTCQWNTCAISLKDARSMSGVWINHNPKSFVLSTHFVAKSVTWI